MNTPTKAQLRDYVYSRGLNSKDAAQLVGVSPRAFRYWLAEGDHYIPYSAWHTLLCTTGNCPTKESK